MDDVVLVRVHGYSPDNTSPKRVWVGKVKKETLDNPNAIINVHNSSRFTIGVYVKDVQITIHSDERTNS